MSGVILLGMYQTPSPPNDQCWDFRTNPTENKGDIA